MIRENEVSQLIVCEIPSISISLSLINKKNDLYKAINCLTDHTKEMIRAHRSSEVMQCFQTAYELLHQGTSLISIAMVNIFISPVSRLLEYSFAPDACVKAEFISKFGKEYSKLIYSNNP